MAKIGIVPGKPFEMNNLDPAVQAALKDIPQTALKKIEGNKEGLGAIVDGWVITKELGTYEHQLLETRRGGGVRLACNSSATRCIPTPRSMLADRS